MSETEEAPKKKKKKKRGGKGRSLIFFVICCVLAVLLKAAFMFVLIGMLPTFAARYADDGEDNDLFRAVLACNVAGIVPHCIELYQTGIAGLNNFALLMNSRLWLVVYGMASIGYILIWCCPRLALLLTELSNRTRISRVENAQRQLVEEWGSEIQRRD